jgi:hypothetical protein
VTEFGINRGYVNICDWVVINQLNLKETTVNILIQMKVTNIIKYIFIYRSIVTEFEKTISQLHSKCNTILKKLQFFLFQSNLEKN